MPKDAESAEPSTASTLEGAPQLENEQEVNQAFSRVFGDGDAPTSSRSNAEDHDDPESTASLERADEQEVDPSLVDRESGTKDEAGGEEDGEAAEGAGDRDAAGEDGGEPTLDPVLRHAARRAGWKDDEIDELAAAKPEIAERTFERLHSSYSDLSARYAQLGQQNGQAAPQDQPPDGREQRGPQQRTQQQPADDDPVQQIFGEQAQQLAQKYGDDFMQDVVKPMASHFMGVIQPVQQDYQRRQQEEIGQQVDRFFDRLPETHQELYGAKQSVSSEQGTKRQEVAQLADQIMAGAEMQNVPMSIDEALDRAVTLHAKDHLSTLERKRITSQVQSRSSRLTARPSGRRKPSSGQPSKQKAQEAVAAKMSELGMDQA